MLDILKKEMSKFVIMWDLDGTLICSKHRLTLTDDGKVNIKKWLEDSTEENIMKDELLPLYKLYIVFQDAGFTQICMTARKMQSADFEYLENNGLFFDRVIHREKSTDIDSRLKDLKMQEYLGDTNKIPLMAFDDKNDNLKVLNEFGFRTFNADFMNTKMVANSYDEIEKLKAAMF